MPNGGTDSSMFKIVEKHDILISQEIMPRLEKVEAVNNKIEKEFSALRTELANVRNSQGSLELTVMKDGAQTRDILLNRFVDHYLDSDGKQLVTKEKVELTKLGTKEKVWLAIIGMLTGGGLATIGTVVIQLIQK
ncbi:hypothetical protein ACQKDB_16140 [Planococcus kocurii]|uniref:hypothetical protein n=1 Tax=Planococcus kocurii TaxID=1374 RepID=UPI003CFFE05A